MKKIAFILLSVLLLFYLVSCGGGEDDDKHNHEHATVCEDARTADCTEAGTNTDSHPEDIGPGIDLPIVPN